MNAATRSTVRFVVMAAFLGGVMGCSAHYKQQWNSATPSPVSTETLAGRWEGRWLSDKNGHHGKLRCIVTQTGTDEYQFHYWARFWKIFSATYKITITEEMSDGELRFRGSQNLGFLYGGVYSHEGKVTAGTLSATYRCKFDHGTFDMQKLD
ncbi:MAG: hypothetical protein IIA65_05395 [Planctomycetes bacterium]|nr:hypothetical protein [Planctomycetota bacterium]